MRQVPLRSRPAPAQEQRLFKRYYEDGDVQARDQLICQCLPLARHLARRYARSGESAEDLVQVASIGLIKAVDRFDPTRGNAFSSFAVPSILGELRRHFRDHAWAAHVPRSVQERALQVNAANDKLMAVTGRAPTPREVAALTGHSVEEVIEAMFAANAFESTPFEASRPAEHAESARACADTLGEVDERYEMVEYRSVIDSTMRAIPKREMLVLTLRFDQDLTQSEIAARIGISQMHVSRLIRRALDRLRTVAEADQNGARRHFGACTAPIPAYAPTHDG